jgi:hypothetical protein
MKFPVATRGVWAGILFIVFGALALWLGPEERGNATQMAAGDVPALLGYALFVVGALLIAQGLRTATREVPSESLALRPFLVLVAVVAFALLLERAGLVIATFALLVIGARAARDLTLRQFAILAVVLYALVFAIFVWGLGLPVSLWPALAAG